MKAEAGWGAVALVAAAAVVGVNSTSSGKSDASAVGPRAGLQSRAVATTATTAFQSGPCVDLESHIQTFLLTSPESVVAPDSCYDETDKNAQARAIAADQLAGKDLRERAAGLQFVIAILPDPLHTHLSLSFDRQAEAIQQGAQDEGYLYDSSWMPWDMEKPSLALLDDQDKLDDRTKAREDQPGIMLFRSASRARVKGPPGDNPRGYQFGLAVFVVGEEATSGIHKRQFENAVRWIDSLHPQALSSQVQILGPSFSGSLLSLSQLMMHDQSLASIGWLHPVAGNSTLAVYSGGISSESAVNWFVGNSPGGIKFRSFQEGDNTLLTRYRKYLINQGFEISRLALVSEDETAFGGLDRTGNAGDQPCAPHQKEDEGDVGPVCIYYPRDISALRAAYQKQSIFNTGAPSGGADASRRALSDDLADPEHDQHDTVRNYSGNQTPLSQEAVLQQIVSVLKAHKSEYVVLRSSNPLDQLFLSHFLRVADPEARVVIEGSDLLLRRESGAATLSGIMTLTTYPLLPWGNHWIRVDGQSATTSSQKAIRQPQWHIHRVFAQEAAEGTYVAARFLLHPTPPEVGCKDAAADAKRGNGTLGHREYFLPPNCAGLALHDYAPPFWANTASSGTSSEDSLRPATWLSVLGRDGFWPVAALNDETVNSFRQKKLSSSHDSLTDQANSWAAREGDGARTSLGSLLAGLKDLWPWSDSSSPVGNGMDWPPMPSSMKICLFALFLLAGFHLHCSAMPSLMVKPGHRTYFVRTGDLSHTALMVLGSVFLAMTPVVLGWGYGVMSANGEPLPHNWAWWYRVFPALIWLLAGAAVGVNAWVELKLHPEPAIETIGGSGVQAWLVANRGIWGPVVWYAGATFAFYCLVDIFLNATLNDANRIPTYWRAIHLTTGVSPLVPLIALPFGLYLWFWYSLQGLALFNADRPLLPKREDLAIDVPPASPDPAAKAEGPVNRLLSLRMFSEEEAGRPIEELCRPLSKETLLVAAVLFPLLLVGSFMLAGNDVPIRSLGSKDYSLFLTAGLDVCASLMLANAWQLLQVWLRLRQLLVFLDRLHLRITLKALKGYSWGSVWGMGGRVLDVRYKLLSRQMESLTHLSNSLKECKEKDAPIWRQQIAETQIIRASFAQWFSGHWNDWKERDLGPFQQLQEGLAGIAAVILVQILVPAWRLDETSLVLDTSSDKGDGGTRPTSEQPPNYIRNAEEFVCLAYMAFIQNVLGRMRTIVMQILLLFIAATVSIATYPFDPRPALSGAMMLLFGLLGVVVVIVYSQMHRDATLSYVTDTKPGELGMEFWFKLLGFGLGPALGLLATIFPELPGSLFSLLQPGVSSLK